MRATGFVSVYGDACAIKDLGMILKKQHKRPAIQYTPGVNMQRMAHAAYAYDTYRTYDAHAPMPILVKNVKQQLASLVRTRDLDFTDATKHKMALVQPGQLVHAKVYALHMDKHTHA